MAVNCSNCGFEPFEGDEYCRKCGTEIDDFTCECGADVMADDKFCHSCGAELGDDAEEAPAEAGPYDQQPAQPAPAPSPQPIQPIQQPSQFQDQF